MDSNKNKLITIAVIVLLAIIYIVIVVSDLTRINKEKKYLTDSVSTIKVMIGNNLTEDTINKIMNKDLDNNFISVKISTNPTDDHIKIITIEKEVNLYAPGISLFFHNPYKINIIKSITIESLIG